MTLRAAVWGLGPHAVRNVLPAFAQARGVELAGVYSRTSSTVAEACAQYGCGRWESETELLADPSIDVVYLSTPIALHAEQGRAILRAGKHFWCEKPLATRAGEAEELAELSRDRGVTVAEGFMYLYHAHFTRLRAAVEALGRVDSVVCRFGIPPLERASFRSDPALGGGAFLDVGCYPVSAAAALFPGVEAGVVRAEIDTAPGSAVDTAGRTLLRFGGTTAWLEWRTDGSYRSEIDVWGELGSVWAERIFSKPPDVAPRLRLLDRSGRESVEEVPAENHFVTMLEAFRGLADDAGAAERERGLAIARARLMDRIRDSSPPSGRS